MIKYFEDCLYEKTKDSKSEILYAQWSYDKQNFSKALQAVSNLFPHYSLHDESHSITILNNIIRIIGKETINKLSSIDIWLLLEAAYCHDIGMVVSSDELITAINSNEFVDFFKDLIDDKKNGLHEFANLFEVVDNSIKYRTDTFNFEMYDGIKFVLAEYFRRLHADRSKDIIIDPQKQLSIISPRGAIPQRIIKILADICAHHTKTFSEVLKLPFCEVGIDIEDAHPRYVACLLRIGDLLDLDNNRFSEVMLRTLSKIPIDTINHKAKHLSIESFRVDKEVIEIIANCKDYDTANITQHWFNYLNSEINNQMINWNKIVPVKDFGYLPTIGNLKVILADYENIDGKNKPKFTVDTDKALSLLQGAGLYDGAYQCIREVLQNAVDSSLIRIWLEYKDTLNFDTPLSLDFSNLTKQFPIIINIEATGIENGFKEWIIEIEDKGTGISSSDLKYLMKTGSSSKNKNRMRIIDQMPNWLKPSGIFGIGFQSIFMITDCVTIKTKSFSNEEYQEVELNSPNSKKDGDILIRKAKTSHLIKPGTKLNFRYRTKAIPDSYSIKGRHETASKIAHEFDPFSHESLDIDLGRILDEVYQFASKCYFPIKLKINNEVYKTLSELKQNFQFYDSETSLELSIYTNDDRKSSERTNIYYKNQPVETAYHFFFLNFDINVHGDKATDVLTLNRNKLNDKYNQALNIQVLKLAFKIIIANFEDIFQTPTEQMIGSMFLNYYHQEEFLENFDIKKFDQWKNINLHLNEKDYKIADLLNTITTLKLMYDNRPLSSINDAFQLDNNTLTITFNGGRPSFELTSFFIFKASEYFTHISEVQDLGKNKKSVTFTKDEEESFILGNDINNILKIFKNGNPGSARAFIPCNESFVKLRVKDEARKLYVFRYYIDRINKVDFPKMLSPFIIKQVSKNKSILKKHIPPSMIDWVFENRHDSKTTKEEIVSDYERFCNSIDIDSINTS